MNEGIVVWFTGLPASGKSTLANRVRELLADHGKACCLLDGDTVRAAFVPSPGYTVKARDDFYHTLANLAGLLAKQGHIVLVPATAHLQEFRDRARRCAPQFIEVHVATPLSQCKQRDFKRLYQHADANLPGQGVAFESPNAPDIVARGGRDEEAATRVYRRIAA